MSRRTGRGPAVPKARLAFAGVLLVVLATILVTQALVNARYSPDTPNPRDGGATSDVPQAIADGGPIIDSTHDPVRSFALPARTIALTFDDGPSADWTPRILAVLRKYHVHATFFTVGDQVARYPAVARRIVADGNEIGSHSFTHPDLSGLAAWRRGLELSETEMAVAGATGLTTSLIRFPYSSGPDALDNQDWRVVQDVGRRGYLSVLTDTDSEDWNEKDVDAIVRNATPEGGRGAVVLMHDSGGDRSRTVKALDRFVPLMLAQGYRFTTVSEGLGLVLASTAKVVGNAPASRADRLRGRILIDILRVGRDAVDALGWLFLLIGALTLGRTVLLFVFAGRHARRRRASDWSWGAPVTEPVSVVVPAYNEKEGIEAAVRSLAGGDHPGIEVVVVDDGSTDGTAELAEGLGLPNVRVVRVANGGKPAALNIGVAHARHNLIVMVDGDTIFEPSSVRRLVQPFGDPRVGAVAGNVKVANRDGMVARWQHVEYVIGFNLDRRLYDTLRCMPTIPGAIGAFRRQALADVGGVSDDTLAEDTDLTMALCRAGWRVVYEEGARAWTEAPATLGQLWKQRYRWSYGTMQAMWKHRRALRDRGPSGRFGRVGLPMLALFNVALPLLAPLFDVMTVYGLFVFDRVETVAAWLGMLALQFLTAVVAFRLDKERLRPLWVLPLQQFVYRQLMYLVLLQSVATAVTGARLRWHKLRRTGVALPERTPA